MPKLDTRLYGLVAQWFDAKDDTEERRLRYEGQKHLQLKGYPERQAELHWALLTHLMEAV